VARELRSLPYMATSQHEERGHVTLDAVDPKEVLASLRSADVATTLRLPVLADEEDVTIQGIRLPVLERTALDAALAAAADRLDDLEDLDDDSPTVRGMRPPLDVVPEDLPTTPAATMVREALLAATRAALSDAEPDRARTFGTDLRQTDLRQTDLRQTDLRQTDLRQTDLRATEPQWTDEEDHTMRADRRAFAIALGGDHPPLSPAPKPLATIVAEPPALPLPLVRRVDAWIDELP
jgi:hypothetical protein